MIIENNIERVKKFIIVCHYGQTDKAGAAYYMHPVEVMDLLPKDASVELKSAALLHDVIEDIPLSKLLENAKTCRNEMELREICDDILESFITYNTHSLEMGEALSIFGFSDRTIEIVRGVTRDKSDGLTYIEWVRKIVDKGDKDIICLKLTDNIHNSSPERIAKLPEEMKSIKNKYIRSMKTLQKALDNLSKPRLDL